MTYRWYARFRLAQLYNQRKEHRQYCADYKRRFACIECNVLCRKIAHYERIKGAA